MEKAKKKKILLRLAALLLILQLFILVIIFLLAGPVIPNCENYKSQVSSLCNAKATQPECESTADMFPEIPGNECEWLSGKCTIQGGLDWSKAPNCAPRDPVTDLLGLLRGLLIVFSPSIAAILLYLYANRIK
jgi:hypothetical protein